MVVVLSKLNNTDNIAINLQSHTLGPGVTIHLFTSLSVYRQHTLATHLPNSGTAVLAHMCK